MTGWGMRTVGRLKGRVRRARLEVNPTHRIFRSITALLIGLGPCAGAQAVPPAPLVLQVTAHEPRAYGYQVGDVLRREMLIQVPTGLVLDEASLPRASTRGAAIELRGVALSHEPLPGGQQQRLLLDYQVFLAPKEVRTLEIAPISLRYVGAGLAGSGREQLLRIDAWPVTVAPLLPQTVSSRQGLGDLQPDVPPPLINLAPVLHRLQIWAGLAALLGLWFLGVSVAWPWWQRRHQPFGRAWASLRRVPGLAARPDLTNEPGAAAAEQWLDACRCLHQAINQSAGQVVFEAGLVGWITRQPMFKPAQADLARFLALSNQAFFSTDAAPPRDGAWLRALCKRCYELERGG